MRAKKFYGQHFLRDERVVEAIVAAANLGGVRHVLEIGPGEGVLTRRLVEAVPHVVAVDIDREAIELVCARVSSPHLTLIERDVLTLTVDDLRGWFGGEPYVLVGNIPYNITADILNTFLTHEYSPTRSVLMVQEEVARRMTADAGDMSRLGLLVQLYASVRLVMRVGREAFTPPPKVDSAVVRLDHVSRDAMRARGIDDPEPILHFAGIAFTQKRKQLVSTLGALPNIGRERVAEALRALSLLATARPQELSAEQWVALHRTISSTPQSSPSLI